MTAFAKESRISNSEDKSNREGMGERESEEVEERMFDQVLESLMKLTEKDCETVQVSLCML